MSNPDARAAQPQQEYQRPDWQVAIMIANQFFHRSITELEEALPDSPEYDELAYQASIRVTNLSRVLLEGSGRSSGTINFQKIIEIGTNPSGGIISYDAYSADIREEIHVPTKIPRLGRITHATKPIREWIKDEDRREMVVEVLRNRIPSFLNIYLFQAQE